MWQIYKQLLAQIDLLQVLNQSWNKLSSGQSWKVDVSKLADTAETAHSQPD